MAHNRFEAGYTGDGFTHQADEDAAEQDACERAVEIDLEAVRAVPQHDAGCLESGPRHLCDYCGSPRMESRPGRNPGVYRNGKYTVEML